MCECIHIHVRYEKSTRERQMKVRQKVLCTKMLKSLYIVIFKGAFHKTTSYFQT